jgi:hypothetical protein
MVSGDDVIVYYSHRHVAVRFTVPYS